MLLAFVLVFVSGCKKEKDESAPNVHILSPAEGYSLSVPDTLTVSVQVDDDQVVERLVLAVTDENGVPIAPSIGVDINAASAVVQRSLVLNDERLPSGLYTIMAYAFDGTNEKREFVRITIQAAPLRLRAIFVTPPPSTTPPYPIMRIDSTGAVSEWNVVSELNGAAIDPHTRHLILAGGAHEPLTALPTDPGASTWSVANQNSAGTSLPYFLGLRNDPYDNRSYFGTNDGAIKGFNGDGLQAFNAQALSGHRSQGTAVLGDLFVSHQRENTLGTHQLVAYAYSSGVQQTQFPLDLETVGLYRRTDEHVLLFGNRSGEGVIQERNVVLGGNFEMRVFTEGPINAVVRLNDNTFVIALPDRLVRFEYASNNIFPLAPGILASALAYEPATGALYVGSGNSMNLMDPQTGATTGSFSLGGPVGTILPLLNRRP